MPVIKLTQAMLATIATLDGKKRIEYVDADFPGLYLEVRAASPGTGTWYFRYRGEGNHTRHQPLGRSPLVTLIEARQKARKFQAEVELGADPRGEEIAKLAVISLDAFFYEHYLPYVKPRKRSWDRDEELYRLRISSKYGAMRINQVGRQQIQSFQTALLAEGLAPATANHHIKLIRHMLNLAVEWELLDKNPASRIPMLAEDNKVERYMDDEQLARLLKVLATDSRRSVCMIAMFLLSTGCRLNEAISATWDQIDMDKRVWRIPASNSKSKRMRPVPLNDSAIDVISQTTTEGEYEHLFINKKTKKPYVSIAKVWTELRNDAELPNLRLHDLRHQAASMLINSESSLYLVGQVLGHADPITTQRYAHLSINSLHAASAGASAIMTKAMPMQRRDVTDIR